MHFISRILLAAAIFLGGLNAGFAANTDPLFINMTTSDAHRSTMAIGFGKSQFERGHQLTIFLNDKGVLIASAANKAQFTNQQNMLSELVKKGAVVFVCPTCIKHYGIKESDLLPGLKVSNPDLTGNALFQENTKTLSW
ncbi:MAG: DsrE/DsrF-like family protein [Gammaproteobacteria bacterium]|uniref:Sulfur relay (Sulfurtransferase) complex TusBCD TusD component (DsrE family) n=1 Tax=Tolumonas osonensis TaxID=675874 RepID=A0A841GJD4_9GAMM|nr:DsrE family protein [Tolumonas osonensis]MBB6055435.1 sulfur relay (sulfurtransferase) complex TusBCD TusD component (DsrE family) [Tolumonas osonensis]NCB60863.1 DsrE/DsrF-like family protein [Gammaproteobacteria bacterium]